MSNVRDAILITSRISQWAGGTIQAIKWYTTYPVPAFGGKTAMQLVEEGKTDAVLEYLDSIENGDFA